MARYFLALSMLTTTSVVLGQPTQPGDKVSSLLKSLAAEDSHVRLLAAIDLQEAGSKAASAVPALIERATKDKNARVRAAAIEALEAIDPDRLKELVPVLVRQLRDRDWSVQNGAAKALSSMGPVAVPALIGALREQDAMVRAKACEALGEVDPLTDAVVPALIVALKHADGKVRAQASSALAEIGPITEEVIPALVNAPEIPGNATGGLRRSDFPRSAPQLTSALVDGLKNGNVAVRRRAAWVLADFPEIVRLPKTTEALLGALKDGEARVRDRAAYALRHVETTRVVLALLEATKDKDADAATGARSALGWIRPKKPGEVMPALTRAMEAGKPVTRKAAAHVLSNLGVASGPAVKLLIRGLADKQIRHLCAMALAKAAPDTKELLPVLSKALRHGQDRDKRRACECLAVMGRHAEPAVPELIKAIETRDEYVLRPALKALAAIGRPTRTIVPAIARLTDGKGRSVGELAAGALAQFGADGRKALLEVLASKEYWVAHEAVRALERAGPDALELLQTRGLRHASPAVRARSAKVLGSLGKSAAAADLGKALADRDPDVRTAAAVALEAMGPASAAAAAALVKALGSDGKVPMAAMGALQECGPAVRKEYPDLLALAKQPGVFNLARMVLNKTVAGDKTIVPDLLEMLGGKKVHLRMLALELLAAVGPEAKAAEKTIAALLDRDDVAAKERILACRALLRLRAKLSLVVPQLAKIVRGDDRRARLAAIRTLGDMGPAAKDALPAMQAAAKREQSHQQVLIVAAVLQVDPANKKALSDLIDKTRARDEIVRMVAWASLTRVGAPAVPAIIEMARTRMPDGTAPAARTIAGMGRDALPPLVAALRSPHSKDRRLALQALGELWYVAGETTPSVLAVLGSDPAPEVRAEAAEVLKIVRPAPKRASVVPGLLAALEDPHHEARAAAAGALGYRAPLDQKVVKALDSARTDPYRKVRDAALRAIGMIQFRAEQAKQGKERKPGR